MTNQEIFELIDRFERSSIRALRLSTGDMSLEMSKDAQAFASAAIAPPVAQVAPAAQAAPVASAAQTGSAASAAQAASAKAVFGGVIAAPLAGVFYAASAPGEKPYISVGDHVKKGDTVCLMEAMKMISEIPAPCDCIITQVLKENGTLAGFDEPLFGYQPC